uniref:hypothetical protein n=1 Tax=Microbispora cellulosiformans TaxID=2614688 RepID=UPI001786C2A2|nr:hypothetical protein [Microbispora cellulosiformans]
MDRIRIDDIAAAGPELDEGDLRLVNGGRKFEWSSQVMTPDGSIDAKDLDF